MFIIILTIILSSFTPTQQKNSIFCEREFQPILAKVQELPDAAKLVDHVLKEGSFHIEKNRHLSKQFEGYWSWTERTVYLTKTKMTGEADLISTLLFELHNAKTNGELDHLGLLASKRMLSKKGFVRAMEHIEYRNAKSTSSMLDAGIDLGLFPVSCYWPIEADFESHLAIQENSGHSKWIEDVYGTLFMDT